MAVRKPDGTHVDMDEDISRLEDGVPSDDEESLEEGKAAREAAGAELEIEEAGDRQEPGCASDRSATQSPEQSTKNNSSTRQTQKKPKQGANTGKAGGSSNNNKAHKSPTNPSPNAAPSKGRKNASNISDRKSNVFASYKEVWMQQTRLRKLEAEAKMAEAKARNAADAAEHMKAKREEADRMKREMELVMQARVDNSAELRESVKQMAASLHENAARNREDIQLKNREEAASYRASVAQMLAVKKKEWDKRQKELVAQAKAMNSNAICDNPKMYWVTRSKEMQQKEMDRMEMERRANEDELRRLKKQEQKLMRKIEQSRQAEEEERRRYETYLTGEYRERRSGTSPAAMSGGTKKPKASEKTKQSRTMTKSVTEETHEAAHAHTHAHDSARVDDNTPADDIVNNTDNDTKNDEPNDQAHAYDDCDFDEGDKSPDQPIVQT